MQRFKADEKGALLLTGIFMLIFLTALLYFMIGMGRTIMMREGLQDAADAAALSSAIFHAKGMDLIAFINIVMSILVGVLVLLKMGQALLYMMAGIFAAFAWFGGATGALIGPTYQAGERVGDLYDTTKKIVEPSLEALHSLQEATSVVVPYVAMASALNEAATYQAPAEGAFALPHALSLPVESDKFKVLCKRGAERTSEFAMDIAMAPIPGDVELPGIITAPINKAAGAIGPLIANDLCGNPDAPPSSYDEKIPRRLPSFPGLEECRTDPEGAACTQASEDAELAMPLPDDGECKSHCGYNDPYEYYARRAREACESTKTFKADEYQWQRRRVRALFTFDGQGWQESSRRVLWHELEESTEPPCGHRGTINDEVWNLQSGPPSQADPDALCAEKIDFPTQHPPAGTSQEFEFLEVGRIFSCTVEVTQTTQLTQEGDALSSDDDSLSPHKVEAGLTLGSEALQIRALAFGPIPGPSKAESQGVRLAAWDQDTKAGAGQLIVHGVEGLAAQTGRFAVAQAEYFYDHRGDEAPAEWMWNMNWKARLKRFRLADEEEEQQEDSRRESNAQRASDFAPSFGIENKLLSTEESCSEAGGEDCESASGLTELLDSLVLH